MSANSTGTAKAAAAKVAAINAAPASIAGSASSTNARGTFITLEGVDGCGKSTQAALLADALEAAGAEVVRLREPGGTKISEQIRAILLDPANAEMGERCELLLYEAARAQLVSQVIAPALARGAVVVCDRYFDSTYAYQHGARGLDESLVESCNDLGSCGVVPDRTILLDLDPRQGLSRATADATDRLEAEGVQFQERVRAGYLRLAKKDAEKNGNRVHVVDATGSVATVFSAICADLADVVKDFGDLRGAYDAAPGSAEACDGR